MDAEFRDDTIGDKGGRLPMSPRVNGMLAVDYSFMLASYDAFLHSSYSYKDGHQSALDSPTLADAESYAKWDMRLGLDVDQWSFAFYGNNLTNEDAVVIGENPGFIGYRLSPRTLGLDLAYTF